MHKITTLANFPLPEDDDGKLLHPQTDNTNTDTPLTQFTPNLPCVTQERHQPLPEPEDSQACDETCVVTRFFSKTQSSLSRKGNVYL